ncbi:MAG: HD domain-containing protein [Lachnospiraceae bacterium]|nr:HD domain-containing protein [Lachnospiraceae bacterium]
MFDLIREHQLNAMLVLCGACGILTLLLFFTRFMSKTRRRIHILMLVVAFFLLWFDRLAYIYAGVSGTRAYVMVRLSNFFVFFLTSAVVFGFNLLLKDWLGNEGGMERVPRRLDAVGALAVAGMALAVISAFTGLYYTFNELNEYQRGDGFLIAYIIPVLGPMIQFSVIVQYRKSFRKLIFIALLFYIFGPIICGIVQIFTYGISIVNMSMVFVSILLYLFTYVDINNMVVRAHEIEMRNVEGEKERLQRLFGQTAGAMVAAVEKRDDFARGQARKVAEYAKRIAEMSGKSADDCEKIYYAALLHDVGMIGIPDSVIKNEEDPGKWDREAMRQKPLIGREILSSITEYPYLAQSAYSSHERYNGTGYPEGLSGEDIPEIARIVAVADAYVTMTSKKRYREARPEMYAREAFVKGAGDVFDPVFAGLMVKIIDQDSSEKMREDIAAVETKLSCGNYRDRISVGIPLENGVKRIRFECVPAEGSENGFSAPSIILFDSYDRRIHSDKKTISEYRYLEYGEVWFDEHLISTGARKIVDAKIERKENGSGKEYGIVAERYDDHLRLKMDGPSCYKEIIVALPDGSKAAYVALTGENCEISAITVESTDEMIGPADIPRIADEISFIDRMEADLKNIQIDRTRSASTEGVEVKNRCRILFHSMSLPGANLVWHCPYVVLFSSADGRVGGPDYREYVLIKLNGENEEDGKYAQNSFVMKKKESFPGWDRWKEINKEGMECELSLERKGSRIILKTENLGISIESTTIVSDDTQKVYAALTGDEVALTDIRVE